MGKNTFSKKILYKKKQCEGKKSGKSVVLHIMNQNHSHYENPFYCREQGNLEIAYDMITSRARQLQP